MNPIRQYHIPACFSLILIVACLYRILPLSAEAIWGDELFSRDFAVDFFGAGLQHIRDDLVHPPFYYFLLHPVLHYFGDGPLPLRFLSLLSGMLTVLTAMLWTWHKTRNSQCGLFAGLLLALSFNATFYSQEARSYALYAFLCLLVFVVCDLAVQKPQVKRNWIYVSLLMTLLILTHYVAVFYLLCIGVYICLLPSRRANVFVPFLIASALPAVSLLTWVLFILPAYKASGGATHNLSWIATPSFSSIANVLGNFNGLPPIPRATTISLGALAIFMLLIALRRFGKPPPTEDRDLPRALTLTISLGIFPMIGLYILAQPPFSLNIWGLRHLLPSQIFLALFTALGVLYLSQWHRKIALTFATVFLLLHFSASLRWFDGPIRFPYHTIAEVIEKAHPHIPAFATCAGTERPVNYYSSNPARVGQVPNKLNDLPNELLLLFRPDIPAEKTTFTQISANGWRAVQERHFACKRSDMVVILVHMKRPMTGDRL